ncbi:MAG TPA: hypothetical protein VHC22_12300 [Pirellulales bacterium]|nr:hypothetical protein [Pirellulales bacterium]
MRADIERKYREALAAFEVLRAYMSETGNQATHENAARNEFLASEYARELEARQQAPKNGAHGEPQGKAAAKVAKANGVSASTVKRAVRAQRKRQIATAHQPDGNGDGQNGFRPGQPR